MRGCWAEAWPRCYYYGSVNVVLVLLGALAGGAGAALIRWRIVAAELLADAVRQNERASSFLSAERRDREIDVYTSEAGKRVSRASATALECLLVALGLYVIVLGLAGS